MTRPMIRIHNTETNEIIDREMNDEEFAYHQQIVADVAADKAEIAAAQAAKEAAQTKLAALGLTADDLKALGL